MFKYMNSDSHHWRMPLVTYASAVREFKAADMYRCHVAVNNAIRKIFSFAVWQSIRTHSPKLKPAEFLLTKPRYRIVCESGTRPRSYF